jgi:hypothetical protein
MLQAGIHRLDQRDWTSKGRSGICAGQGRLASTTNHGSEAGPQLVAVTSYLRGCVLMQLKAAALGAVYLNCLFTGAGQT